MRPRKPKAAGPQALLKLLVLLTLGFRTGLVFAAELKPETARAWDQYFAWADAKVSRDLQNPKTFLIQDQLSPKDKLELTKVLRSGHVYAAQMTGIVPRGTHFTVPGGAIHHWWGAVLVPGVRLSELIPILQDYDHLAGKFAEMEASKLLSRKGNDFRFSMRLRRTKSFVTAYYNTTQECRYFFYGPKHAASRSIAVRIAELEDPGTRNERERQPGNDRGFLWKLVSWWRFAETEDGVIVELESASLSRDIPTLIAMIPGISGYIKSTPKESLVSVLTSVRQLAAR